MAFESTESFYQVQDSAIISGPHQRPTSFGDNSPDSSLAASGWYRLWHQDAGEAPGKYYSRQAGPVLVDEVTSPPRCTRTDSWVELSPEEKRAWITDEIEEQVANGSARRLVEDLTFERSIESTSGGASERKSDLEDEDDANLDAFDSAITPTPSDGAGFIEARMTTFIDVGTDPWVGAPDDILSLQCVLEIIRGGDSAAGASARAHMFGPKDSDNGAVMSFSQDGTNPNVWRSETQTGRYWQDPTQTASMRLKWNNGSLPVAETKVLQGQGDRHSAVVRAPV